MQFSQHQSMANVNIYRCLPHVFCACSYRFNYIQNLNFSPPKSKAKVTEFKFCNYTIRSQMSLSTNVSHAFLRQLLSIQKYKFSIFYLRKVGHRHWVQFLQIHNSMANVKTYKCLSHIFRKSLSFQRYTIFTFFTYKK